MCVPYNRNVQVHCQSGAGQIHIGAIMQKDVQYACTIVFCQNHVTFTSRHSHLSISGSRMFVNNSNPDLAEGLPGQISKVSGMSFSFVCFGDNVRRPQGIMLVVIVKCAGQH